MARQVNDTQPYQDKLVKLIPTEIVGAYMVLAGMLGFSPAETSSLNFAVAQPNPDTELKALLIQIVFFFLLVFTPVYLKKFGKVSNVVQLVVTSISYIVWIYTLGGPFVVWGIHYALVGSVVLVLWSLVIPVFVKPN